MKYLGPFLVGSAITVGAFYAASVTLTPLEDPRPPELQAADALMFAPQPIASASRKPSEATSSSSVRTVALQNPVPSTMIQPDPGRPDPAVAHQVAAAEAAEPTGRTAVPPEALATGAAPAEAAPTEIVSSETTSPETEIPETVAAVPAEAPVIEEPVTEAAPEAEAADAVSALPPDVPMPKPANRPPSGLPAIAVAEVPSASDVDARFDSTEEIWAQKEDPALAALVKAKAAPDIAVTPDGAVMPDGAAGTAAAPEDDPLAAMIASAETGVPPEPVEPVAVLPGEEADPATVAERAAETVAASETPAPPQAVAEPAPPSDAGVSEPDVSEPGLAASDGAAVEAAEAEATGPGVAEIALADPAGAPEASPPIPDPAESSAETIAEEPAAPTRVTDVPPPAAAAPVAASSEPGLSSGEQMAAVRTPSAGSLTPEPAKPSPALNPGELQLTNVVVLDAGGFRAVDSSQGLIVRIAGVEPLPFNRMCKDQATGRTWPCGAHARAALSKHIGGRTVACRERQATRKGQIREIRAACTVDGEDVARWLVTSGWAEASSGDAALVAAADDARRAGRGQFAASPSN